MNACDICGTAENLKYILKETIGDDDDGIQSRGAFRCVPCLKTHRYDIIDEWTQEEFEGASNPDPAA